MKSLFLCTLFLIGSANAENSGPAKAATPPETNPAALSEAALIYWKWYHMGITSDYINGNYRQANTTATYDFSKEHRGVYKFEMSSRGEVENKHFNWNLKRNKVYIKFKDGSTKVLPSTSRGLKDGDKYFFGAQ
jgi:hypothetical protein